MEAKTGGGPHWEEDEAKATNKGGTQRAKGMCVWEGGKRKAEQAKSQEEICVCVCRHASQRDEMEMLATRVRAQQQEQKPIPTINGTWR